MSWTRQSEGTIAYEQPRMTVRWWINKREVSQAYGVGAEYNGPTHVVTRLCQHRDHRSLEGAWACVLALALVLRASRKEVIAEDNSPR